MTESRQFRAPPARSGRSAERDDANDDAERALARIVSWGLPIATWMGAVLAGVLVSLGSALLVLASGTLLGAIAFLWGSLRTLSGDAPLAGEGDPHLGRPGETDLAERKRRVLLSLKDLESERALGKIDEADYQDLVAKYRDEAKTVMREMDRQADPTRGEAERVAREFLARHGYGRPPAENGDARVPAPTASPQPDRVECRACQTSNEIDAAFCKQCGAPMKRAAGSSDAKV
jgi:hypothetical protein